VQLTDYVRAIAVRWAWVVAGGILGLLLLGTIASLTPVHYRSSVTLYVGATLVDGPQDPAYATLVRSEILPSVAALGRSASVLAQVSDSTGLSASPDAVTVDVRGETDLFVLSVTADTPAHATVLAGALGQAVAQRAEYLYPRTDKPLLTVVTAGATGAAEQVRALARATSAALGAVAGAALAAVAAGLAELARPRVRGRRDVALETSAPVLCLPAARVAGAPRPAASDVPERSEQRTLLRWMLRAGDADGPPRRIAVTGPASAPAVTALTRELAASAPRGDDVETVYVPDVQRIAAAGPVDGILLVADARNTTRRELQATVEAVESIDVPVVAAVVDGLLPSRAGWRAWLRAGAHGDARWSAETRGRGADLRTMDGRPGTTTRVTAALALAALGFTRPLPLGLSAGLMVAVALLPVWLPSVRRARGATALFVLAGLSLTSGALLAWFLAGEHAFTRHDAIRTAVLVATAVSGVGLILWARSVLRLPLIGISFGLGALLSGLATLAGSQNSWKFELSFPVAVIVLSIVTAWRRPVLTIAALCVLGAVDVLHDYRSALGFCGLAALLVLWQARPSGGMPRAPRWVAIPLVAGVVFAGYSLLTHLLVSGVLGSQLQQRTVAQIADSGSLLLSGRPEWTATWALMVHQPLGYGLGIVPTAADVAIAKQGLALTHVPTVDGYLEHYMLNGGFELHSIVADLWVSLGPLGVVLGLAMGALVVHGLGLRLSARRASALVCFLVPLGLWNLAFGPLPSDVSALTLGLGLLLATRTPAPPRIAEHTRAPGEAPGNPRQPLVVGG
jgi:capsular polysaccharide biosynthesis protein